MTLHGRSRQQRYSKSADWNYIRECADTLRATVEEANRKPCASPVRGSSLTRETINTVPMIPIFGNGDCFSAQQYYEDLENSGVDGIMVARGALIKPWIFTCVFSFHTSSFFFFFGSDIDNVSAARSRRSASGISARASGSISSATYVFPFEPQRLSLSLLISALPLHQFAEFGLVSALLNPGSLQAVSKMILVSSAEPLGI